MTRHMTFVQETFRTSPDETVPGKPRNGTADRSGQAASSRHLFPFMKQCIRQLQRAGQEKTSSSYAGTLRSFGRFRQGKDIRIDRIDAQEIKRYENWLRKRGVTPNTSSFYMRVLRAVYNRAAAAGITEQRHPFRSVYTGTDKTVKRAAERETVSRLKQLPLPDDLHLARDLFLFGFYTRGMAFVDIVHLKKKNIDRGYIRYRRKKTGQPMQIRIEPCIRQLLEKYADTEDDTEYLFPVLSRNPKYASALRMQNKRLKRISLLLDLPVPLTTYVARHTWASLAKKQGIPLRIISESMGHENENTTRIYLASLDASVIDRANRTVIQGL